MSIRWDNRKPVCAVPGEGAICGSETEQGNRDLRNLTLGGACGECHFVSAGGQDIQTEAVVCPFIGTDVRQIDRKIAIQFIKFDGRFVHIGLVCRTIDNIDPAFCAKQPVIAWVFMRKRQMLAAQRCNSLRCREPSFREARMLSSFCAPQEHTM